MLINRIFYNIKPYIPRRLQIFVRCRVIASRRKKCSHIWPIDPAAATSPVGWKGWPGNKKFALVLSHDVDTQKGHDKCYPLMEIEENMGFRSSFNFVPEGYNVSQTLLNDLKKRGFEVCVHGLVHDGKLFSSRQIFDQRAEKINAYLKDWGAGGFTSPSMHHNLDWMHALNITHSTSTFDTDPFEPQPDAVGTIFPLWVQNHPATVNPQENVQCCSQTNPSFHNANGGSQSDAEFQQTNNDSTLRPSGDVQFNNPKTLRPSENVQFCSRSKNESILTGDIQKVFRGLKCDSDPGEIGSAFHRASEDIGKKGTFPEGRRGYVELPYTLPQDFTLFVLMKEQTIDIWKRKLDWIAENGGMALFNAHPDYMNFNRQKNGNENYSAERYIEFLEYIKERYKDQYWHARPKDVARFWKQNYS